MSSRPTATVPDGHELCLYRASPLPDLKRTRSGAVIAQQGDRNDESAAKLAGLIEAVEVVMRGPRPRVLLSQVSGPLSELFAPHDPRVNAIPGLLIWVLNADILALDPGGAAAAQRLLRLMYRLGTAPEPLSQAVFLRDVSTAAARALAALLRGAGLGIRVPDPPGGEILAEVDRPEGVTLAALLGPGFEPAAPDPLALQANRDKDAAEEAGDTARLAQIEAEERAGLEARLRAPAGASRSVEHAPRMRRLLLSVHDGEPGALRALYEEILRRDVPVLLLADAQTRGVALSRWPQGEALPVFADRASLYRTASDREIPESSFAIAELPFRSLLPWAASEGWALALNAFRDASSPIYIWLAPDAVRALARGELP